MENNLSKKFINVSEKISYILTIVLPVYFVFLILYDLFVYKRGGSEIAITYIETIIICLIAYLAVHLIFRLQIKIQFYSDTFFSIISITFLIVFGISSIILGIFYLLDNFYIMTFIAPTITLSVLRVQKLRK